ncbi:MAG: AAA family ATPase [Archangium sp.]
MRFNHLTVKHLRAVIRAELSLGPKLNVLYGPNDLGKSTLATALRAALLFPNSGALAESLVPWQSGEEQPEVTLQLTDSRGTGWRIYRRFTSPDETLEQTDDSGAFHQVAKGKKVTERLRNLLAWGLPATPRKGSAPSSFLTSALVGEQDHVASILEASLDDDADQTGHGRIAKVLSALARDPLVVAALAATEKEVGKAFTPQGKRKASKSSPLALALATVETLTAELEERTRAADEVKRLEASLTALEKKRDQAQQEAERAEENVRTAERRSSKGDTEATQAVIESAQQALDAHDENARRKAELDAKVQAAQHEVAERTTVAESASRAAQNATAQVQSLEASERDAKTSKDASKRAVARAELESTIASQQLKVSELTQKVQAAKTSQRGADDAKTLAATKTKLGGELAAAKQKLDKFKQDSELTSGIIAYGQWRKARDARDGSEQSRIELTSARADLTERTTEREHAKREASELQAKAADLELHLPDAKSQTFIAGIRRELDLAEAALGGGFTLHVRPRTDGLLRVTVDDGSATEEKGQAEKSFEVEKRATLGWGNSLDLEVIAGAPEKRRELEHLKKRWKTEAFPHLDKAGLRSVKELDEKVEALAQMRAKYAALSSRVKELDAEVARLQARFDALEERTKSAPSEKELEERKARIGRLPLPLLEQAFGTLGARWELETSEQHASTSKALTETTALVAKLEGELQLVAHRLDEAGARQSVAPGQDEAALTRALKDAEGEVTRSKLRLASLDEGKAALDALPAQLKKAKDDATKTGKAKETAEAALDDATGTLKELQGELKAVTASLSKSQRERLVEKLEAAKAKLSSASSKETTGEVKQLRKAASEARTAADKATQAWASSLGALERLGGANVFDRLDETQQALARAQQKAERLSVDADAWKLLHETATAAEKELSSNFGAALAAPVSRAFSELTKGRYGAVKFDASLQAQGVEVEGAASTGDIDALSVGTRDHLATLTRLALATHLGAPVLLDDQLVHSDAARLGWFRKALLEAAEKTQVIVLTCRPLDYPTEANGARVVDLEKLITRR